MTGIEDSLFRWAFGVLACVPVILLVVVPFGLIVAQFARIRSVRTALSRSNNWRGIIALAVLSFVLSLALFAWLFDQAGYFVMAEAEGSGPLCTGAPIDRDKCEQLVGSADKEAIVTELWLRDVMPLAGPACFSGDTTTCQVADLFGPRYDLNGVHFIALIAALTTAIGVRRIVRGPSNASAV
jgi:hypothetical protein